MYLKEDYIQWLYWILSRNFDRKHNTSGMAQRNACTSLQERTRQETVDTAEESHCCAKHSIFMKGY
jgi:hypothetical protein